DYLLPTHGRIQMISKTGDLLSVEEQGSTAGHEYPMPTQQQLLDGYRQLVIGRRVNDQNYALVRQGRMAVYPSSHGQEASEVAAPLCLSPTDLLFPSYRDTVALLARAVEPMQVMTGCRGDWLQGYDPHDHNTAIHSTASTTQSLHAVGMDHAARVA